MSLEFVKDAAIMCVPYSNHRRMSFFSLSPKNGISGSNLGKKTLSYSRLISVKIFFKEGGIATPSLTEKHNPFASPSP